MNFTHVKVEVLLPEENIEKLRNELNSHGLLQVGNYDHVISYSVVKGYWRPLEGSTPFQGAEGEISYGSECKMEFRCSIENMDKAKLVINEHHPYEEPVVNVVPLLE
ncbi:cytochrome C biogenesis protein [Gracilibacillus sp. S3-1-1]|uniref:Cytochrome C biogenesis protein n=1 Tax=Gracilibacillus pellucidus TaxID=3095368 RepID=A0ACC6M871_9BACI|nr:cytochrome C biogenesis protein [Gracilibacillus sp. S3-1-1]MDX8047185.1 cytochrome C biogenesis protein [Gracilibacillus sp. S3-1-1]